MANFKDGIIRDGSQIGWGTVLGNVDNGLIREGNWSRGSGNLLGNVDNGLIREGNWSRGSGNIIGKVSDFRIEGMEREPEAEMIAAYHFLVKKIFL